MRLMLAMVCAVGGILLCSTLADAQTFTYQGMLKQAGVPANGNYDFQFNLWTAASGGSQVGSTLARSEVNVAWGVFSTELDFGSVWDGSDRYLQVAVRPAGSGSYTTLSPRVKVNRAPYSQFAFSVPWSGIVGMPAGFADGVDNDTTYSAGAGLQLAGTTFGVASGGIVTGMLADGAVTPAKLSATGVSAGTYGSATQVGRFTVDAQGRITSASNETISGVAPGGSAGGDLGGSYPNPVVTALQTRPVSSAAPGNGEVLKWDGSVWAPALDDAGGLTLPFTGSSNVGSGAVFAITNTTTSGFADGIWGRTNSTSAAGVLGWAMSTTGTNFGGFFRSDSTGGRGVTGTATAATGATYGVVGGSDSNAGTGVFGVANASSGTTRGVHGEAVSPSGIAVSGYERASTGRTYGGNFRSDSSSGTGVYGLAADQSGNTVGVYGQSLSSAGTGVVGLASASSGTTFGVWGQSDSDNGRGVYGFATRAGTGVYGRSDGASGWGVIGVATASSGTTYGVFGQAGSNGYGVYCIGNFGASGIKSFQIDHPLSPDTHFLNHYASEGPEPYNLYRGNVVTDAQGYATITLPDYFEAINREPTYHLTVIDASDDFVLTKVVREIHNNQFIIRTSKPLVKVSWEVKAVRNDRWVQQYGYQTEQPKPKEYQGRYLHPELYGLPKEMGIHYHPEHGRETPVRQ
ncbi:MAG: hypothetical protein HPY54_07400 [Chthonomonadetes bacterium]|nr:hypothetical protein [Chthonomonadetes bacterium]